MADEYQPATREELDSLKKDAKKWAADLGVTEEQLGQLIAEEEAILQGQEANAKGAAMDEFVEKTVLPAVFPLKENEFAEQMLDRLPLLTGYWPQALAAAQKLGGDPRPFPAIRDAHRDRLDRQPGVAKASGTAASVAGGAAIPVAGALPRAMMSSAPRAVATGGTLAALQGGLANPGDVPGEYSGPQLGARLSNARDAGLWGLGAGTLAASGVAATQRLAEIKELQRLMANPKAYQDKARGLLRKAAEKLREAQAKTFARHQKILADKNIEFETGPLALTESSRNWLLGRVGVADDADSFMLKMRQLSHEGPPGPGPKPGPWRAQRRVGSPSPEFKDIQVSRKVLPKTATLRGDQLNDLKIQQDRLSKRPAGALYSEGEAAKRLDEGTVGNRARAMIERIDPGASGRNDQMQRMIQLRRTLQRKADNDAQAFLNNQGRGRAAVLQEVDELAEDSALRHFGKDTQRAEKWGTSKRDLVDDLQEQGLNNLWNTPMRYLVEAGLRASPYLDPATRQVNRYQLMDFGRGVQAASPWSLRRKEK